MLKVRKLGIDACQETVAYLARQCEQYRAEEFTALARIEIWDGARWAELDRQGAAALATDDDLGDFGL